MSARFWTRRAILDACRRWKMSNGKPPTSRDWRRATPCYPAHSTVTTLFGTWNAMIVAAGYRPEPARRWTRARVVAALLDWTFEHGRFPTSREWGSATDEHPHHHTVRNLFGSWDAARREAGFVGSRFAKLRTRRRVLLTVEREAA